MKSPAHAASAIRIFFCFGFCVFFIACYSSSAKLTGDGSQDVGREDVYDVTPDRIDAVETVETVDIVDIPDDPEIDAPPFLGITFVVQNWSSDPDGTTHYFSTGGWGDAAYAFNMQQYVEGEWRRVDWLPPWCTVECTPDIEWCCIDCALMLAVKELGPGEEFSVYWDGSFYAMNFDLCDCGCYYPYSIPEGRFEMTICGYRDYECWDISGCEPGPDGMIWNAEVVGDPECTTQSFEIPDASGETITFYFPPGIR